LSYGWGPRLQLRRPTSLLVIKCTTLLTCIENSYYLEILRIRTCAQYTEIRQCVYGLQIYILQSVFFQLFNNANQMQNP
jgi:hypothetical protein